VEQARREEAAKTRPDPLLREAAAILADALDLLESDHQLIAQVLPLTRQPRVWAESAGPQDPDSPVSAWWLACCTWTRRPIPARNTPAACSTRTIPTWPGWAVPSA